MLLFLLLALLLLLLALLLHLSNQQFDYIPWQCRLWLPALREVAGWRLWLPDLGEVAGGQRCCARHSPGRPLELWPCIPGRVGRVRRTADCRSRKSLRGP